MFGKDFYPTPPQVISKMIAPWYDDIKNKDVSILEPSAGKGNILDYLLNYGNTAKKKNMYAIEVNPDLQSVLTGKKYRLIGSDFLDYSGHYHFDYIIMNPPFSEGAKHALKAWDVLKNGKMACLLNAETINNPCTKERELLAQIIKDNGGEVEFLGDCFSMAERKTGVNVAMIRLEKKTIGERLCFSGERLRIKDAENLKPENLENQVARANYIQALVDTYDSACRAAVAYCQTKNEFDFYANTLSSLDKKNEQSESKSGASYNEMVSTLNQRAWKTVFEKTNIKKLLTSKVLEDWQNFQETEGQLEFNVKNINNLFDMLILNKGKLMNDCLLAVFDRMCRYHAKNKVHFEGWKTNDAFKVNRKVILPHGVEHNKYGNSRYSDKFSTNYHNHDFFDDIDKVLCLLSGKSFPESQYYENTKWKKSEVKEGEVKTILYALREQFDKVGYVGTGDQFDNTCESTFFRLKFWKKGTLHFEFKDSKLWEQFNIQVAKGKGWLPGER